MAAPSVYSYNEEDGYVEDETQAADDDDRIDHALGPKVCLLLNQEPEPKTAVARLLLDHGADVHIQNASFGSAWHAAAAARTPSSD